ncbi:MAG: glycosyltransferase [Candidatus Omnitrophica bacterium]|nr:glycosyltransferase [Candidatus Omnitrophota bacterium]
MVELTVCIITYNSAEYLGRLLESIGSSSIKHTSLLIIDNASEDGTPEIARNFPMEKEMVVLDKNEGHSRAANIAIDRCNTRFLVLLDHDTVLDEKMLEVLHDQALEDRETDFAVFAPRIIDKGRNEIYHGGYMHFIGKTITNRKEISEGETGMIGSTAPLIDLEKLPENIRFDEEMFIYWNDADFFYRMRKNGLKIKYVPEAVVYHFEGTKDYSHRSGASYSWKRAYYLIRNHKIFLLKTYDLLTLFVFFPCFILYELYNMLFCVKKGIFLKAYLPAVAYFIKTIPQTLRKRAGCRQNRRIADIDLIGWYPLDYNPGVVDKGFSEKAVKFLDEVLKWYFRIAKGIFK